jgi:predicted N-acetyltransferase YhbS
MEHHEYRPGNGPGNNEELVSLFLRTFSDSGGKEEGALIGKLVRDFLDTTSGDDLSIFVTVDEGAVIASIVFSRLFCEDGTEAFLMAPVAVDTAFQKRGIGQQLIRYGLEVLRTRGVTLVMSYGDINFYSKTGFAPVSEEVVPAPLPLSYPAGWIGQALDGGPIRAVGGTTRCVAALGNEAYW